MRYLVLLLLLVGCSNKVVDKPVDDKKPVVEDEKISPIFRWNNSEYDEALVRSILKVRKPIRYVKKSHALVDLLPKDWKDFVDRKPTTEAQMVDFWGNILVEMSYWESKWKTNAKYTEAFRSSRTGKNVVSRGLFQMSLSSSNAYGCGWKTEQEIHDKPLKAIDCAVATLAYWIVRDGCLACKGNKDPNNKWDSGHRGGGRYWAVFRGHRDYTRKSLKALKNANRK